MNPTDLITTVAAEIRLVTGNIKKPVEYHDEQGRQLKETWKKIQVFEGYIPFDLFEQEVYYPCVTVELIDLKDTLSGDEINSLATIGLQIGVFAKEFDGWKDAFHVLQIIRRRLLTVRTIGQKYRLAREMLWQVPANQPEPFFFVNAEIPYWIYQPAEPFEMMPPDLLKRSKK